LQSLSPRDLLELLADCKLNNVSFAWPPMVPSLILGKVSQVGSDVMMVLMMTILASTSKVPWQACSDKGCTCML
jgi:hypothetical protein